MKIAIIGAEGAVGSRLIEQLHLAGEHTVIPIVRDPAGLARSSRFDLAWRLADPLDSAALRAALRGCDVAVHTATGKGREIERMPPALCAAAAAVGLRRVIYLSCASVYGPKPEPGTNEHTALHTTNASKDAAHRILADRAFFQHCRREKLEGIALRPGRVYGPRSAWFAELARELRDGRAWWFGEGRGIFNGIYVDNLTSAIFSALAAPASATGKPYLVGDEETITWREFYLAVATLIGASAHRIANVSLSPTASSPTRSRLRQLADASGMKAVAPLLSPEVKRFAKYMLAGTPDPLDPWNPAASPGAAVTLERTLQQQCRWRFPHKRAARSLGFHAPVSVAEGLRRTVAWLGFAEGELPRPGEMTSTGNGNRVSVKGLAP